MIDGVQTCSVCPRLCRHACPVAVGTGREAATPTALAGALVDYGRGLLDAADALGAATLCVDCGACQDACHIDRPLPELLREARAMLEPEPALPPLPTIPLDGVDVVLEVTEGDAATWAAEHAPSAHRVTCPHALGVVAVEHPVFLRRAAALRRLLDGRTVYSQDGAIHEVLARADVPVRWCLTPATSIGSCQCSTGQAPPMACCGARGPLSRHHPRAAERVARAFARRLPADAVLTDQRCARHLRAAGERALHVFDDDVPGDRP